MMRLTGICSFAALLALAACGGDAAVAILGTLGAGGGDWLVDANPTLAGYQPRTDCGSSGTDLCRININPGTLYERNYAVTGGGNFNSTCAGSPAGTVSNSVDVSVPGCFVGRMLSVNEALSTDGSVRAYFDFSPDMATGVWVDIHDDGHRFVFTNNSSGCEFAGASQRPLSLVIQASNFRDFADGIAPTLVSETAVQTLTIQGTTTRSFSGEFVGASGLRLTRSGETIELQRRDQVGSCT